jgi:hypothetical protein
MVAVEPKGVLGRAAAWRARILHGDRIGKGWPWILVALLAILATKLILISIFANVSPYYDQWTAETPLYRAYLDGRLSWHEMLAPHNEHRIFFSRLLFLALLEFSGTWNVVVQMVVNALMHLAVLLALAWLLRRLIAPAHAALFALMLVLAYAIPFDWENLLWGFQSQFYFLLGLSLAATVLLTERAPFTPGWFLGLVVAGLSMLAMSSGAVTPIAAAAFVGGQIIVGARTRAPREIAGLVTLLAFGAVLLSFTVTVPAHAVLKARGPLAFAQALITISEWPFKLSILGSLILNTPMALMVVHLLRTGTGRADPRWRLVALFMWLLLQFVAMAYARAADPMASRYMDLISLGPLLNLVALLHLAAGAPRRTRLVASAWTGLLAATLVWLPFQGLAYQLGFDRPRILARDRNLAAYVRTGDPKALDQPFLYIPFVGADGLIRPLRYPQVRGLLPRSLGADPALRVAVQRQLVFKGGLSLEPERARGGAMALGVVLAAAAAAFLLMLLMWRDDSKDADTAQS